MNITINESPVAETPKTFLGRTLTAANSHQINRDRRYIVKGLLMAGQVSMLCGAPNVGKSAIMAAICAHVAMGRDFADHKVQRCAVFYNGAEDAEGILDRAYPYMSGDNAKAAPFNVFPDPINLLCEHATDRLVEEIVMHMQGMNCGRVLFVCDTLNLCIGDGDENSARDMGRVMANAQRIAKASGAHVMMIHHTGSQNSARPRGSTVMTANIDTLLTLQHADDTQPRGAVFITQQKQRSVKKTKQLAFQIEAFDAGLDSEGDPLTFPMAVPYKPHTSLKPASSPRSEASSSKQSASAARARAGDVLRVLKEMAIEAPGAWANSKVIRERTGEPFNDVRESSDSLRKATDRALELLVKDNAIQAGANKMFRVNTQ